MLTKGDIDLSQLKSDVTKLIYEHNALVLQYNGACETLEGAIRAEMSLYIKARFNADRLECLSHVVHHRATILNLARMLKLDHLVEDIKVDEKF